MKRRDFLIAMAAGATLPALPALAATGGPAGKSIAEIQKDWQLLLAKDADVARSVEPITKTEVEWKQVLPEERFYVLPHPEVEEYVRRKGDDVDRWLLGMRRLRRRSVEPGV